MAGAHPCRARFISPCSPYFAFRRNVSHTVAEADTTPKPMQSTGPRLHIQDDKEDEGGKQSACEDEQVLRLQSLNSTGRPMPLLIGYSAIVLIPYYMYGNVRLLKEERTENRRAHNQEDTRPEPARGGLRCVGVARRELAVHLDAPDKPDDRADGVDEFRAGVEIAGHEVGSLIDARHAVALCGR